jgi:hypothetical protein
METIAAFASRTGPGDPNESFADYVERLKAKAADPKVNELIKTTYYRLWDEHKPDTDDEQATIEPMTVESLEGQLGEMTADLVDLVIFGNEPMEYKEIPPPPLPYDLDALGKVMTWQNALYLLREAGMRVKRSETGEAADLPMLLHCAKVVLAELDGSGTGFTSMSGRTLT